MRVGESHGHSRVGWAGALEAPSRGRCGMVPSVTVAVETVALRRAAREQKPPIKELYRATNSPGFLWNLPSATQSELLRVRPVQISLYYSE